MAGRKPKPTHLKLVTGNPGKRKLNNKEPKPKKGVGAAPAWLSKKAKIAWPKVVKMLLDMNVVTVSDTIGLEVLCEAYADLLLARESLKKPITYKTSDGKTVTIAEGGSMTYLTWGKAGPMLRNRPEMAIIADAERRLKSSLADFGLTPAARSKIQVLDGDEKENPEEDYFSSDS